MSLYDAFLVLWVFLGAAIANASPIFAARIPHLKGWRTPLDGGHSFRGKRIFGKNKTWRGLIVGILTATVTLGLQQVVTKVFDWHIEIGGSNFVDLPTFILGPLLGAGPLIGDAVESFFKRQLDIAPGKSWFPFDQIDYIIGGIVFTWPIIPLTLGQYCWIFILGFGGHLLISYIGYLLKFKDKPI